MTTTKTQIIIIGAGIAGLSAYILLHKHLVQPHPDQYSITIYEAYDVHRHKYDAPGAIAAGDTIFTPKVIGNAIGIGKNGLSVLSRMDRDESVLKTVQAMGNTVARWRMCTARGWKIVDASVAAESEKVASGAGTVMIARQVFWEILRNEVLRIDEGAIRTKKVTVIESSGDGKAILQFGDGSTEIADLVIGADGLRSIVRQTIFAELEDTEPQTWLDWVLHRPRLKKDYTTPKYEGLTGLGGFVPGSVLEHTEFQKDAMSITFGPNGFFGHGYIGHVNIAQEPGRETAHREDKPMVAWWSTFSSDVPRPYQPDPNNQASSADLNTNFDRDRALKELLERHSFWVNDSIQSILSYVKDNVDIEHIYPTYTTPELPTWTNPAGNMILIGDAAHALQPSSGQGACQALEDAEALSLFLKHCLTNPNPFRDNVGRPVQQREVIKKALRGTVNLRMPRVAKIYQASQKMSSRKMDMGIVQEYFMYFALWVMGKMKLMKKYNEELFGYDVPSEVEVAIKATGTD